MRQNEPFNSKHFVLIPLDDGELLNLENDLHPTRAYGWGHQGLQHLELGSDATHFCFVLEGPAQFRMKTGGEPFCLSLCSRMYASFPGGVEIEGGSGVVVSRVGYRGVFVAGGPIEGTGRLRYIDGCSDSLLIPPVIRGDPCLNHLHFPRQISQTRHTHPSVRVGLVVSGRGRCVVPADDDSESAHSIPLQPGNLFVIPVNGIHSFFTGSSEMDVIAYHPDSDTGPHHDDHPMVNRTIVDGRSAAQIPEIRTR